MNGRPDAIICGLTAALNVSGTAVPVDGDMLEWTDHY